MVDDPLIFTINTVLNIRYGMQRYVRELIHETVNDVEQSMNRLKLNIVNSGSSRRTTYREINLDMSVHDISITKHNIREIKRMSFTQFRLSAHSLAVEVGRWGRRGRGHLPLEERLCICRDIQTEVHVAQHCPITQHIRENFNSTTIDDIFSDSFSVLEQCEIVHSILYMYK